MDGRNVNNEVLTVEIDFKDGEESKLVEKHFKRKKKTELRT